MYHLSSGGFLMKRMGLAVILAAFLVLLPGKVRAAGPEVAAKARC